jgi:hypothetical protein
MLKVHLLLFLFVFGSFLFVVGYVCLNFAIQYSNVDELGWGMEWFPSFYGNCF